MTTRELSETGLEWMREAAEIGLFSRRLIAQVCGINQDTFYKNLLPKERGGHAPSDKTRWRFKKGLERYRNQQGGDYERETDEDSGSRPTGV